MSTDDSWPGVYFSTGLINLWAAVTIADQGTLIFLLALGVFLAGIGRLVSIAKWGCPSRRLSGWATLFLAAVPVIIAVAQLATNRRASQAAAAPNYRWSGTYRKRRATITDCSARRSPKRSPHR